MRGKIFILLFALFLVCSINVSAKILLQDTFEGKLNTNLWNTGYPNFVYTEGGRLILNQKKSGGDYARFARRLLRESLRISSKQSFEDCVIYYEWFIDEWSGEGDGGGGLRVNPGTGGYYMRWWGRQNVKLTDNNPKGAIPQWQPWPTKDRKQAQSTYSNNSDHFVLKAALILKEKRITIGIWDVTNPNKTIQIADWVVENDDYPRGTLHFDCWKFGIYAVDNVIVATPDAEAEIFREKFDPLKNNLSVSVLDKLTTTWGHVKNSY